MSCWSGGAVAAKVTEKTIVVIRKHVMVMLKNITALTPLFSNRFENIPPNTPAYRAGCGWSGGWVLGCLFANTIDNIYVSGSGGHDKLKNSRVTASSSSVSSCAAPACF